MSDEIKNELELLITNAESIQNSLGLIYTELGSIKNSIDSVEEFENYRAAAGVLMKLHSNILQKIREVTNSENWRVIE